MVVVLESQRVLLDLFFDSRTRIELEEQLSSIVCPIIFSSIYGHIYLPNINTLLKYNKLLKI